MTNPVVRGYVFSRDHLGGRAAQHVQNIVIRDYCHKQGLHFLLSAVEYAMDDNYMVLNKLLSQLNDLDGLVFYSFHQLPQQFEQRQAIYKTLLDNSCHLHFALEQTAIQSAADIDRIEDILMIQRALEDQSYEH